MKIGTDFVAALCLSASIGLFWAIHQRLELMEAQADPPPPPRSRPRTLTPPYGGRLTMD